MFCPKTVHSLAVAWSLYRRSDRGWNGGGRRLPEFVDECGTGTGTAESARNSWRRHLVSHHLAGPRTAVRLPRHHATPHDRPASTVHCLPRTLSLLYSNVLFIAHLSPSPRGIVGRTRREIAEGRIMPMKYRGTGDCSPGNPRILTWLQSKEYLTVIAY